MSKGIQIILKCLAIVLAIGMLGTYVWLRQRATSKVVESSTLDSGSNTSNLVIGSTFETKVTFPVTPSRPDMFDTSKSGKIDATVFSGTKGGLVDFGGVVNLEPAQEIAPPAADPLAGNGENTKAEDSPAPVILMPGSKSFNMPIFNTKDVTKVITPWDGRTEKAAGSRNTKKEDQKGTQK